MLSSVEDLKDYVVHGVDGDIGQVTDFFFDKEGWAIRYLVVDTGSWLRSRKVLISTVAIQEISPAEKKIAVAASKALVENSPDIDIARPISCQNEHQHLDYFGYPNYWGGTGLWGAGIYPGTMLPGFPPVRLPQRAGIRDEQHQEVRGNQIDETRLCSCQAIIGYYLHASDGDIGHVNGMLVEQDTWAIRYFIVDTSNWWLGHQVLIAPKWISEVRWPDNKLMANLTRQAIKDAIPYEKDATLDREQELGLHLHDNHSGKRGAKNTHAGQEVDEIPNEKYASKSL
jgi:hypothetical protein